MSGFITMQREALDHPLLKDAERFRAWFWLIAKACWKPTRVDTGGRIVSLERGQLCYSIRYLADAWGWPRTTVDRFLRRLESESMLRVTRSKTGTGGGTAQIIITICNYDKYQTADREDGTANGTRPGQQRDSSGTNKNKGNKGNKIPSPYGDGASDPAEATPIDFAKVAIDSAIAILVAAGRSEQQARRLIGKWRQTFTDGQLIDAVARARERSVADPAAFLAQQLHHDAPRRQNNGNSPRHHDHDEPRNPFVRAALERQAERAAGQRE